MKYGNAACCSIDACSWNCHFHKLGKCKPINVEKIFICENTEAGEEIISVVRSVINVLSLSCYPCWKVHFLSFPFIIIIQCVNKLWNPSVVFCHFLCCFWLFYFATEHLTEPFLKRIRTRVIARTHKRKAMKIN